MSPARVFVAAALLALTMLRAASRPTMTPSTSLSFGADSIVLEYTAPDFAQPHHALFVAIDSQPLGGSAFLPYGHATTGSTVTVPFRADRLYRAQVSPGGPAKTWQEWKDLRWSGPMDVKSEFTAEVFPGRMRITVRTSALETKATKLRLVVFAKDMTANGGWGELLADPALQVRGGQGDRLIDRCYEVDLAAQEVRVASRRSRAPERMRIYQLMPRLFSNTNETRKVNGTRDENGVGKFADINSAALKGIADLGFTHVWLTGVLNQATATDYSAIGYPADDPALLKGIAGSPYAVRDLFDVSPDYAVVPSNRREEFRALLDRAHDAGLKVIIDFVPNHVARCYHSQVKPELTFGRTDQPEHFFSPAHNFFWLQADSPGGGAPLRLPREDGTTQAYLPESEHGRVTGNNAVTWTPSINDWYETVKLNYGFDFTNGHRAYPHAADPSLAVPDTWAKMDAAIEWWQGLGVDGFRCDMAHMVPPDFWAWMLDRARSRFPETCFVAEAYDNDPMKVGPGNVMLDLLAAGFDGVYDDPSYKVLKGMYDGGNWANDLDTALAPADREFIFRNSLRYAENHDEVRLAGRHQWGGIGPAVGKPVSAILFGVGNGPLLVYSGQEVGEPAHGPTGFGGDNARTTIFDYWSMPELAKWVNGHRYDGGRLSPEQQDLRAFYGRLVRLMGEPAFRDGEFFALNYANHHNGAFGRTWGESFSGHWLYAFLRSDLATGQRFLCVVNLNRGETLRDVHVHLPSEAIAFIGLQPDDAVSYRERLSANPPAPAEPRPISHGCGIPEIPALTPFFFEIVKSQAS